MKLIRNFAIVVVMLALVLAVRRLKPVLAQGGSCADNKTSCVNQANANYNNCVAACNGDPNCQSSCQNTKQSDLNTCDSNYNNCMIQHQDYCQQSACPSQCQGTTGVAGAPYNDASGSCQCSCGCSLGSKPNCPGASCLGGYWSCQSPIVIDTAGEGFHLTNAENGVFFDFDGNGSVEKISWTDPAYSNGWLALDRNNNGRIDSARELFGNLTPQPHNGDENGYLALAVFDHPSKGGNMDGFIDSGDAIFDRLVVWIDANHNGISEPEELHSLQSLHIAKLSLSYKEEDRTDKNGNYFRYKARIKDEKGFSGTRFTWDVFLNKGD